MLYFLNGFMGSGKSYWGRHWAQVFGLEFYDLDEVIEQQQQRTISEIFASDGEAAFRRIEQKALGNLFRLENAIVACGGGTPCFHHNLRRMNRNGLTLLLKTPVPVLVERLLPELGHRPVLAHTTADTLPAFIEQKLAERAPFYSKCTYHFNTQYLTDENFKKVQDKCIKRS